jgi:hypothetical protein
MNVKKTGAVAAGAVVAASAAIAVGMSNADAMNTAVVAANPGYGQAQTADAVSGGDTPGSGDEAAKVRAAVTAKDSAVTVTAVRKDPDGSYDVAGTKAGVNVMFDVSADLATVIENTNGGARHGGGSSDTAVTGDEAAKVRAAVTAKDSAVTVTAVRKDPDGSYDVAGTKAGANVMFDVSADLATVTENTRS